jgi:RNA polymerase sigma factor (sigma-70 family)
VIDKMAHEKIKTNYAESLQELLDEGHCITEESIREKELMQLIDQEIASLPEKMRQVFQFSRKDYYSHKEISAILNISEQTVKKQVQNALKIIKLRLASFLF